VNLAREKKNYSVKLRNSLKDGKSFSFFLACWIFSMKQCTCDSPSITLFHFLHHLNFNLVIDLRVKEEAFVMTKSDYGVRREKKMKTIKRLQGIYFNATLTFGGEKEIITQWLKAQWRK
jgi:hypothetical protein